LDLSPQQAALLTRASEECLSLQVRPVLSPLEREEREDAIADWLIRHNVDPAPAESLADSGMAVQQLDQLVESFTGRELDAALQWLAAGCTTRHLAVEIRQAAARVSELVSAVKGFTQMDRASVPEPVDVGQGIGNTVIVLKAKAKSASVSMTVRVQPDLPRIRGFAGELNQVWTNLLENAIDAAGEGGHVEATAAHEGAAVVVRVIDNGPGVPAGIRDRIFDPFFTTKPVGKGTGLGLDIVRRLVQRHNGQIELDSVAGRTEFRVTLPVAES
jgi:signal transduction histidine kinase